MAIAVAAATVAGVALGVFALAIGRASTDDVRIAVGALRARAAEAKFVADRAAAGAVTAAYVRAQSLQLVRALSDLRPELERYAVAIPAPQAKQAAAMSGDVIALVQSIDRAADDPSSLAPLASELGARVQALDAAEKTLQHASP